MAIPDISLYLKIESHLSSGMSQFQMDKFVINDQLTPYRQLRQAVMETRARLENITAMGFDIDELRIKKEKAEHDLAHARDDFEKRLSKVQVQRYGFEINRKQTIIDQQYREVAFFNNVITSLTEQHFYGEAMLLEKLDDPAFHQEQEQQFWTAKFARDVFSDLLNYGTVSKGVAEAITTLAPAQQLEIIQRGSEAQVEVRKLLTGARDQALALKD